MRLRFFKIPSHGCSEEEALNILLASERILLVDRQPIANGAGSAWAICVSLLDGDGPLPLHKGKLDYREVPSEADSAAFAQLRAQTIAASEGVPAYALFTNEQLAEMVRHRTIGALCEGSPVARPVRVHV